MARTERFAWLGLAFFVLVLATYVGVVVGVPRYLLARVLSNALQEPVALAQNPRVATSASGLMLELSGLRVGKRLLQVHRLQAFWSWRAIRRGRWYDLSLRLDAPRLRGPWPRRGGSSGEAPTLPARIDIHNGEVTWPVGGKELQLRDLQLRYQAKQGGSLDGQLRYGSQSLRLHGLYQMPMGGKEGVLRVHAVGAEEALQMAAQLQTTGAAIRSQQGKLSLRWEGYAGTWQWQGLHYVPGQETLQIQHWQLRAQPQLQGEGSFTLHWHKPLHLQARWQLTCENLPAWLVLAGIQSLSAQQHAALEPAALEGQLRWTRDAAISIDKLQGILGKTHFLAQLERPTPTAPWEVAATIPSLQLDPWLSSKPSRNPKPFTLPSLPAQWPPLQGSLEIGLLSWGKWQAKQVHITLQQAQS
ncbi:MAG: hypothetical protein U7M05_04775 [Candidatus Igneacidithiobacillus chanchocoensis]